MNRVVAELVGGPLDGARMNLARLHTRLQDPQIPTQRRPLHDTNPTAPVAPGRYDLDPRCVDDAGALITDVARYQLQPPATASA